MASSKVNEIFRSDLDGIKSSHSSSISDVNHLSSYSWIEGRTPMIAVPGLPPLWTPPKGPQKLEKDSGFFYIAQNDARHPKSPIEPLFRSLFITHPCFDIRSVDVVSDRNNIRKLLKFVNPSRDSHKLEAFAINVEVINNTAILGRTETATTEFINPGDFRGFGHQFENKYTTSEIQGATGHHRILSYRFYGMKLLIRHETNAYVKSSAANNKKKEDQSLSGLMGSMSLVPEASGSYTKIVGSKLRASNQGHVVPCRSTLEIKTRTKNKRLSFDEAAPQLWVSQTPNLVRAYHDRGTFAESKVEDVSKMLHRWEADNEPDLRKLGEVIRLIVSIAKGMGGKATVKYNASRGALTIQKNVDLAKVLPEDIYGRWDKNDKQGDGNKEKTTKVDKKSTSG